MAKILLVLLLSMSSLAHAEFRHFKDWTAKEKASFGTYSTLAYIDMQQTRYALKHPCECYAEGNFIFGSDPHIDRIYLGNIIAMSMMYYVVGASEPDASTSKLWLLSAVRLGVVVNNEQAGISWTVAF